MQRFSAVLSRVCLSVREEIGVSGVSLFKFIKRRFKETANKMHADRLQTAKITGSSRNRETF